MTEKRPGKANKQTCENGEKVIKKYRNSKQEKAYQRQ